MDPLPPDLVEAAAASRDRIVNYARRAAADGAAGRSAFGTTMASAAREAIFTDALLAAMRARLEALKGVTK